MDVAAPSKCKVAYLIYKTRKGCGGFDKIFVDYDNFYLSYSVTNAFHGIIKAAKGLRKFFYNYIS